MNVYYQTRMRYLMVEDVEPVKMNDEGMMLYNNGIAMLATVVTVMFTAEHNGLYEDALKLTNWQWVWISGSCIFCYSISYFSFRCQRLVSATSFHILGNVSKVVVVLFGWVVLGEAYNIKSASAVFLALVGAAWYSWDRILGHPQAKEDIECKGYACDNYLPLTDDASHLSPYIQSRSVSVGHAREINGLQRLTPPQHSYQSYRRLR
eukprot:CAMPEP_0167746184 /NCGR_PEP_ID=MMETSP0110_2-20121227/3571_1 /TAXON_ID=629695 /ORGANISM="Gymnochlora sp., Strain CCMP2014" /LENGTH=206 /DNA_ID=CAMNT_0007630919 /DNA_START=508 /DNA_END=1128 /DNA_ORIENTATION=-